MAEINTQYLKKCIDTLEKSYAMLKKSKIDSIEYELYRNSLVKSFEMTLEQSGKLLKKTITPYFSSTREVDMLTFKDIFRSAFKFSLLTKDETKRWITYRNNRNSTTHDYGEEFAQQTLVLIDNFIADARNLKKIIDEAQHDD